MQSGFETKKKAYLDWRVKQKFEQPPIGLHPKKGTTFSRHYAHQTSAYAFLQMSYGQNIEESNSLICGLCNYFLNNPDQLHEPHSFYWATEFYLGIYHGFSSDSKDGTTSLTGKSEADMQEMMWQYLAHWSKIENLTTSLNHHTLWYWLSENHWFMELVTAWAFAHILIGKDAYRSRSLDDQFSLEEHLSLLDHYLLEYMKEKASKGFFVEIASRSYGPRMLVMFYVVYKYAKDGKTKRFARNMLDLWWATWAEEQLNGERGGGKVRERSLKGLAQEDAIHHLAHLYLGTGESEYGKFPLMFIFPLYTDYRIPDLIADIALQSLSEPYEIIQRRLAKRDGKAPIEPKMNVYDYEKGNCLRYSYCTGDFILGTVMRPPLPWDTWILGSAQSWHHGLLIQRGNTNERVVPICVQKRDTIGEQWSVQSKGTLICQKLPDAKSALQMAVFVSEGLKNHTEMDDHYVFIETENVYCSLLFVGTGYSVDENLPKNGYWYVGEDETAPVILEAVQSESVGSFEQFKKQIKARDLSFKDNVLQYRSIYEEEFTFYADQSAIPTIDGTTINYHPAKLFDSKYIQSDWDSGTVVVEKGDKRLRLEFA